MNTIKVKNIAELKTRKGTPESTVEVLGYYIEGDEGGGNFYWNDTNTEIDNGGTIIQVSGVSIGRWIRLYSNEINIRWFGAKVGGNSANFIQNAANFCLSKNLILVSDSSVYTLDSNVNLRNVEFKLNGNFIINHSGIGFIIGGNASSPYNKKQYIYQVERSTGTSNRITPDIRVIGAKGQQIEINSVDFLQLYANANSTVYNTDYSIAYSNFTLGYVKTIEFWTNPTSDNLIQWINENNFFLNRIENVIIDGTYAHNHNIFYRGTFEENATITLNKGTHNVFTGVRGENTVTCTFADGTQDNIVIASWNSSDNRIFSSNLVVAYNGGFNLVTTEQTNLSPLYKILSINYQTLTLSAGIYNVKNVANITINSGNLSCTSFSEIYNSNLIPVEFYENIFYVKLLNKTAGGIRVKVKGYDATKTLLTATSDDVAYDFVGNKGFDIYDASVNDSEGRSFRILNKNTKYISIHILSAGGVTSVFDGMYIAMRNRENRRERALEQFSYLNI